MIGDDDRDVLLASDAGYGFVAKLGDLISKNKSGKAILRLPKGSVLLPAVMIQDYDSDRIVSVTNEDAAHVPLSQLPCLAKGKGNKIINIPSARVAERIEFVVAMTTVTAEDT